MRNKSAATQLMQAALPPFLNNVEPISAPLIRTAFAAASVLSRGEQKSSNGSLWHPDPLFVITMFLVLGTRPLPVSHFWSCELVVLKVSDGPGTPVTWKKRGASSCPQAAGVWTCRPLLLGIFAGYCQNRPALLSSTGVHYCPHVSLWSHVLCPIKLSCCNWAELVLLTHLHSNL